MELKNSNSNGCNVVINNTHLIIYFFPKILKIELNKGLQSLSSNRDFVTTYKLPQIKTPYNFHLINL